jgi:hypothetical protein
VDEEVKTIEIEMQVRTIEPEVGIEPLVVVQVEIIEIIVKEIDV